MSVVPLFAQGKGPRPKIGGEPPMPEQVQVDDVPGIVIQQVASDQEIVWDIDFAKDPEDDEWVMLFTERPGRIKWMKGTDAPQIYLNFANTVEHGEGGLMGLAVHPNWPEEPYLYVMYTTRKGREAINRVSRFRHPAKLEEEEILVEDIAAARSHDGGALKFGPDGMLYVGTGDATYPPSAQDLNSLNGKILRYTPDGKIPADNPSPNSPVWAYGFRNVTGLSWHPETGQLWAASHGPSGEFAGLKERDSIYIVKKGGNHAWPLYVGISPDPNHEAPLLYYTGRAVPPGGAMFYDGDLLPQFKNNYFLATLRSAHMQRIIIEDGNEPTKIERWWTSRFGRLRAVVQGPEGAIYFSTSNRDGRIRSVPRGSDYIFRILPAPGAAE